MASKRSLSTTRHAKIQNTGGRASAEGARRKMRLANSGSKVDNAVAHGRTTSNGGQSICAADLESSKPSPNRASARGQPGSAKPKRPTQLKNKNDNDPTTLFPYVLHQLLDDVAKSGKDSIVSWNGMDTFRVHDRERFMIEILPKYYRQTKYKSFLRQLNLWGFRCIDSGPKRGSYQHACFVRGNEDLCANMKRVKIKGAKSRKLLQKKKKQSSSVPNQGRSLKKNGSKLAASKQSKRTSPPTEGIASQLDTSDDADSQSNDPGSDPTAPTDFDCLPIVSPTDPQEISPLVAASLSTNTAASPTTPNRPRPTETMVSPSGLSPQKTADGSIHAGPVPPTDDPMTPCSIGTPHGEKCDRLDFFRRDFSPYNLPRLHLQQLEQQQLQQKLQEQARANAIARVQVQVQASQLQQQQLQLRQGFGLAQQQQQRREEQRDWLQSIEEAFTCQDAVSANNSLQFSTTPRMISSPFSMNHSNCSQRWSNGTISDFGSSQIMDSSTMLMKCLEPRPFRA